MDEPFVSLDQPNAENLYKVLVSYWEKNPITVILITHNLKEAILLGNRIIFFSKRPASVVYDHKVKTKRSNLSIDNISVQKEYALIMIDIDHFKSVNDKYGHAVGDQVLIEVTERCKDNLRYHDIVARLGGEEFCVLLPYTTAMHAEGIAERLRCKIESMPIISEGSRIKVTISVGISLVCSDDSDGHDAMQRADQKLLEAKQNGRNQVCA